jgi:acyl carrier protein
MNEHSTTSPLQRRDVVDMICQIVSEIPGAPQKVDENTQLFGAQGFLDSLKLVNVVLDAEQQVNDNYNLAISLADDRSVSQQRSPFRTVASLADYILAVAAEQPRA